jgi:hypothetical protein
MSIYAYAKAHARTQAYAPACSRVTGIGVCAGGCALRVSACTQEDVRYGYRRVRRRMHEDARGCTRADACMHVSYTRSARCITIRPRIADAPSPQIICAHVQCIHAKHLQCTPTCSAPPRAVHLRVQSICKASAVHLHMQCPSTCSACRVYQTWRVPNRAGSAHAHGPMHMRGGHMRGGHMLIAGGARRPLRGSERACIRKGYLRMRSHMHMHMHMHIRMHIKVRMHINA